MRYDDAYEDEPKGPPSKAELLTYAVIAAVAVLYAIGNYLWG